MTWTWIEETGGSLTDDRAKEKGRNANQVVMWIHANPSSHVESRFSRKETWEKRA
jgi:hypothetical protein